MFLWSLNMFFAFILSAVFTRMLIPKILLISFRKKLFDEQDGRKIHSGIIPRLGGIAFKPVIFFSVIFLLGINMVVGHPVIFDGLQKDMTDIIELLFGCCAIIILYLVGAVDDLIGIRYKVKFFAQLFCGIMLVISGLWINNLYGFMGIYSLSPFIGYPLTILVIIFITNATNLIDGIDGLASGLGGIALLFYGLVLMYFDQYIYALLAFATLGAIVPFFYYNVFGDVNSGKKIFMGDTGSLTIGIILCILSLELCVHASLRDIRLSNPMILAYVPLIIPCFDIIRVFVYRLRAKKNPFMPDMNHIHHKMLKAGMSQKRAMVIILFVSILFILSNLLLSSVLNINLLLFLDILLWYIANMWLNSRIKRNNLSVAENN